MPARLRRWPVQLAAPQAARPVPRRRLLRWGAVACGAWMAPPLLRAQPSAAPAPAPAGELLRIGLQPTAPVRELLAQYLPLKRYLARSLGRPAVLLLPHSDAAFHGAMLRGEFDLAVSAPHLARVAQLDRGLLPLGGFEPHVSALLVGAVGGRIQAVADVRGGRVAFANPGSLVAMQGLQWLSQHGLEPGADYQALPLLTDMGAGRLLLTGEATAAVMGNHGFRGLPPDEVARLKIVEVFARLPNLMLMAHPRLAGEPLVQLRDALWRFMGSATEGAAFARATGLAGLSAVAEPTLAQLDLFAPATRRILATAS